MPARGVNADYLVARQCGHSDKSPYHLCVTLPENLYRHDLLVPLYYSSLLSIRREDLLEMEAKMDSYRGYQDSIKRTSRIDLIEE
jgi:hypothetical protein